jgi:hypothetical protein
MTHEEPREGQIAHEPQEGRGKKVALVGFAESWKQAPFNDPSVEIWSLNEFWKYAPRWNRWFELHDADCLGVTKRNLDEGEQRRHLEWLAAQKPGKPIYMQPQFCDGRFPAAVPYPLEQMIARFGKYFTSTIGYMLALAIAEGYQWIGLYGIDLASDVEYPGQRPNTEYLIGLARGMGRTVVVTETSALLKAGHLYGYEQPIGAHGGLVDLVRKHRATLVKKRDETIAALNTLDGAIQAYDNMLTGATHMERGGSIVQVA